MAIVSYRDFNTDLIKINGNKTTPAMTMLFMQPFQIQTPFIKMSNYGLPKLSKYTDTELKRCFIKVPLDETYFNNDAFIEKLLEIDVLLNSQKFRKVHLGPNYKDYEYNPLVKAPDGQMKYSKMKLAVDTTHDEPEIRTSIIRNINNVKESVECLTVDDIMKVVKYKCQFRMMIEPSKIWIMKTTKAYGLTLKVLKIEVLEEPKKTLDFIEEE
jgi:hypothetical protein